MPPVRPLSRIDHPAEGQTARSAAGVAWAPPLGVRAVEVRLDGGAWHNAELAAELAPDAWRRWRADLTDILPSRQPERTKATLEVRVIGRGTIQDPVRRVPFPSGASGLHRVNITLG